MSCISAMKKPAEAGLSVGSMKTLFFGGAGSLIRCLGFGGRFLQLGFLGIFLGGRCSGCSLEAGTVDGHAFRGELGGIAFTHALDAFDEVIPVLEIALLAFVEDLGRDAGTNALDAIQLGRSGLVDVYRRECNGGVEHGDDDQDFL